MFVVLIRYTQPIEKVQQHTQAHRDYLDSFYQQNSLIVSGRRVDQTGGVVLANMASHAEVEAFIANDPYKRSGVAEYEVIEFNPGKYAQEFGTFLHVVPKDTATIAPEPGKGHDVVPGPR